MSRRKKHKVEDLELSAFMNILIVLVPILLTNMTISATTILDLKLPPGGAGGGGASENQQIELIIHKDYMTLNYPAGVYMDEFPKKNDEYDLKALAAKLQVLKPAIEESIGKPKRDILILAEEKTDYQALVSTMDAVRSFEVDEGEKLVEYELFPDISLGDSPVLAGSDAQESGVAP